MMTTTPQNPNYRRGDIVLSSLSKFGSMYRQNASRIGCPTRRSEFGPGTGRRLHDYQQGIPLESFQPRNGRVEQSEGRETGLLPDSIVMTDNLATIALSEIDRVIGHML